MLARIDTLDQPLIVPLKMPMGMPIADQAMLVADQKLQFLELPPHISFPKKFQMGMPIADQMMPAPEQKLQFLAMPSLTPAQEAMLKTIKAEPVFVDLKKQESILKYNPEFLKLKTEAKVMRATPQAKQLEADLKAWMAVTTGVTPKNLIKDVATIAFSADGEAIMQDKQKWESAHENLMPIVGEWVMDKMDASKLSPADQVLFKQWEALAEVKDEKSHWETIKSSAAFAKLKADNVEALKAPEAQAVVADLKNMEKMQSIIDAYAKESINFIVKNSSAQQAHQDRLILMNDPTVQKFIQSFAPQQMI